MTHTERPRGHRTDGDTGFADATLDRALGDYVMSVAEAVGVAAEGVTWEVTDTVTAYLALSGRSADHPGRDTMLVWNERQGWVISVETGPAESPIVLSRAGADLVPAPDVVALLVAEAIGRIGALRPETSDPNRVDRVDLAEHMNRHNRSR